MKTKTYGGLLFKNLIEQDEFFQLQCELFQKGLIQGIQLLVPHRSLDPVVDEEKLSEILDAYPGEIFVHAGAENRGVDWGCCLDELGIFKNHGNGRTWLEWNKESLDWAITVANACPRPSSVDGHAVLPKVVIHTCYSRSYADVTGLERMADALAPYSGDSVVIENIPSILRRDIMEQIRGKPSGWPDEEYWGWGTPNNLRKIIGLLDGRGSHGWKVLFDYTHALVLSNQAIAWGDNLPPQLIKVYQSYQQTIADFDAFACPIAHFSGMTPNVMDAPQQIVGSIPPDFLRESMQSKAIICLEIPFDPKKTKKIRGEINWFRKYYLGQ